MVWWLVNTQHVASETYTTLENRGLSHGPFHSTNGNAGTSTTIGGTTLYQYCTTSLARWSLGSLVERGEARRLCVKQQLLATQQLRCAALGCVECGRLLRCSCAKWHWVPPFKNAHLFKEYLSFNF